MIDGLAVFRMDPKIGPKRIYKSENIEEISHQEVVAIFASHNVFSEGFRGVHIGNRTWATYVKPPWIIALLLSPDQLIGPLETPLAKVIIDIKLPNPSSEEQWKELHQALISELQSSPVADLLTSKRTVDFLKALLDHNIVFFDPHFNMTIGTVYPAADRLTKLNSYDTRLFLEKLTLAGIFSNEPVSGATHCPICHGFKVVSRLACPKCSVTAFDVMRIPRGDDVSPALSNPSRQSDGPYYTCITCQQITQEPILTLLCTECGSQFQPSEAEYQKMNRLVLNKTTAQALITEVEQSYSE